MKPIVFTLCFFMCSYSALPMIGTGCGIATDHFSRSGVIGIGARLKCGIPDSAATLATAYSGCRVKRPASLRASAMTALMACRAKGLFFQHGERRI